MKNIYPPKKFDTVHCEIKGNDLVCTLKGEKKEKKITISDLDSVHVVKGFEECEAGTQVFRTPGVPTEEENFLLCI